MPTQQIVNCSLISNEDTISNREIAMTILKDFKDDAHPGKIIIGIWKNKEDFDKWKSLKNDKGRSIRVAVLDSDLLPNIRLEGKESLVLVGLGLGIKTDFSDVMLFHLLAAKRISCPDNT